MTSLLQLLRGVIIHTCVFPRVHDIFLLVVMAFILHRICWLDTDVLLLMNVFQGVITSAAFVDLHRNDYSLVIHYIVEAYIKCSAVTTGLVPYSLVSLPSEYCIMCISN